MCKREYSKVKNYGVGFHFKVGGEAIKPIDAINCKYRIKYGFW